MKARPPLLGPVLHRSILNVLTCQCSIAEACSITLAKLITLEDYGGMRQMWGRCLPERSTETKGPVPAERDGGGSRLRHPSLCLRDAAGA